MDLTVRLQGIEEAAAALDQLVDSPRARRARQRALGAGARVARKAARKTAAFTDRSGRLRKSIKVVLPKSGGAALIAGGAGAGHASLVEFGHGGPHPAPAHPYLEPAVLSTRRQAFDAIARRAEQELDKLAGLGRK